jgi:hypothetical protein
MPRALPTCFGVRRGATRLPLDTGHTNQELLTRHYRELATREQAAKRWNIHPATQTNLIALTAQSATRGRGSLSYLLMRVSNTPSLPRKTNVIWAKHRTRNRTIEKTPNRAPVDGWGSLLQRLPHRQRCIPRTLPVYFWSCSGGRYC